MFNRSLNKLRDRTLRRPATVPLSRNHHYRRLLCEPLEERRLLSVVTLYPDADTFIDSSYPTSNYGASTGLLVGKPWGGGERMDRVSFSGIPSGATINNATLSLNRYSGEGAFTLAVQSASRSWSENTLTWDTNGSTSRWTTPESTYYMGATTGALSVDVTAHVQEWADGTRANYGFQLSVNDSWTVDPGNTRAFYSSEYSTMSYRPRLVIDYDAGTPNADLNLSNLNWQPQAPTTMDWGEHPTDFDFDVYSYSSSDPLSSNSTLVHVYLSDDTTHGDSDDVYLGNITVDWTQSPGTTKNLNFSSTGLGFISIPNGTANGDYYVYAHMTPQGGEWVETDDSDNWERTDSKVVRVSHDTTPDADLNLSNLNWQPQAPTTMDWGEHPTDFDFDVYSYSSSDPLSSNSTLVHVYLSDDTTHGDSDDVYLGNITVDWTQSPGTTKNLNFSSTGLGFISIPNGTANGDYYVYAHMTPQGGEWVETDDSDNWERTDSKVVRVSHDTTPDADLNLSNLNWQPQAPTTMDWGEHPTHFDFDVYSYSSSDPLSSDSTLVHVYLSDDTTHGDSDDVYLGNITVDWTQSPGTTKNLNFSSTGLGFISIPNGTANGDYYVYAHMTPQGGEWAETDDSDNWERTDSKVVRIGDDIDLNDQIIEAYTTSVGSSVSGTISPGTDVDMYRFTVSAGQWVGFDIDRPSGSSLDSWVRLFDSNGTQLDYDDDGAAPGESNTYESYLEYTFTSGGTYYLGVSGYRNNVYNAVSGAGDTTGSTGDYTLILTSETPDTDSNDQISEASLTSIGGSATGTISPDTDVDMYRFTVSAGQRVDFDIDRPSGSSLDSWIRLFNSGGTQLDYNDDGAAPGESHTYESYLEYTFTSGGTYYLGVSGYRNNAYNAVSGTGDTSGSTGDYILRLTDIVTGDPNDQIAEAQSIIVGGSSSDRLSPATEPDVNMYCFTVSAGQRVGFDIDRPLGKQSGLMDTLIRQQRYAVGLQRRRSSTRRISHL